MKENNNLTWVSKTITLMKCALRVCICSCIVMCMFNFLVAGNTHVSAAAKPQLVITVEASDGNKITDVDIQNALNMARDDKDHSYYVMVPEGDYEFKTQNGLHIYSDTTLDLTNSTITKDKTLQKGAFIQVGYPRKETKEYGVWGELGTGYYWGKYLRGENIKIIGGTFDGGKGEGNITTLCTFSHVKNITFEGSIFKFKPTKTNNAHLIEFGGCKNVTLDSCEFYGNSKAGEAVQLESTYKGVAQSDLMGKCDGTKTSNVTVKDCVFSGFQYALGSNHGCSKDAYKKMIFKNNKFISIGKYAVCVYNYSLSLTGNTIKNSGKRSWNSMVLKLGNKNSIKMSKNSVK